MSVAACLFAHGKCRFKTQHLLNKRAFKTPMQNVKCRSCLHFCHDQNQKCQTVVRAKCCCVHAWISNKGVFSGSNFVVMQNCNFVAFTSWLEHSIRWFWWSWTQNQPSTTFKMHVISHARHQNSTLSSEESAFNNAQVHGHKIVFF